MVAKGPPFPGFTALSDQAFLRQPEKIDSDDSTSADERHPRVVIIFSWGDGQPKNLVKYADGYRDLYPKSTQVVVLAPIATAMFSTLEQRTKAMMPVIDAIFPRSANTTIESHEGQEDSILVHTMSNTGGINYAATLNAYREIFGKPMPHHLLVLDSTPGSVVMTRRNLDRWSRAMALGTAAWFPWPFVVTQGIWAAFLCGNRFLEWLIGRQSAPAFSVLAVIDEAYETKNSRQLYLYSQEDDLIFYDDIEAHIAEAKSRGYNVDADVFKGSGHVRHMQMFPDQYWGAIEASWNRRAGVSSDET